MSCTVAGGERREVIRQQWTFSRGRDRPRKSKSYRVTLDDAVVVELAINPDISNGGAHASLFRLRIG